MNTNSKTKKLVLTALFLAIAVVAQYIGGLLGGSGGVGQIITGSIVNMCLILSGCIIGMPYGFIISVLSPCFAFILGIMKFPFAIPVVIIGNAIFVLIITLTYKAIKDKKDVVKVVITLISVVVAACIKALAMWFLSKYALGLLTTVPAPLIASFSFPQVITGTIGGVLAVILLPILQKANSK